MATTTKTTKQADPVDEEYEAPAPAPEPEPEAPVEVPQWPVSGGN